MGVTLGHFQFPLPAEKNENNSFAQIWIIQSLKKGRNENVGMKSA